MNKDPQTRTRRPSRMTIVNCAATLLLASCSGGESAPDSDASSAAPTVSSASSRPPVGPTSPSSEGQPAPTPNCKFPEADDTAALNSWKSPPSNLNEQLLAQRMGVSKEAVEKGMWGTVHCDPGVPIEVSGTPDELLTIEGLPRGLQSPCVPISFDVDAPTAGAIAMNPKVICPASPSAA